MRPTPHTLITVLINIGILYVIYLFFIQKRLEGFTPPLANATQPALANDIKPAIDTVGGSLCSLYGSQPQVLNTKCGLLTETNCNATSCCGWLNGSTCVAGDRNGPTFRTSKGKPIDIQTYSFQNKQQPFRKRLDQNTPVG
jgi:hypothetical protein